MLLNNLCFIEESNKTADNQLDIILKLNPDHAIFKGHFPSEPILPGVCALQIMKELAEKELNRNLKLKTSRNIKFLMKINPSLDTRLDVKFTYKYLDSDSIHIVCDYLFMGKNALKISAIYLLN